MDAVALMNRKDTKFVFSIDQLPELLTTVQDHYRILEVNNVRLARYSNIYYDTEDLKMYQAHHNGKLNRYKVRKREYTDSGISFFEIKFKSNKRRTVKERISESVFTRPLSAQAAEVLEDFTPFKASQLQVASNINFRRITLVGNDMKDRCTLDIGLEVFDDRGKTAFPWLAIMEVKQSSFSRNNTLIRAVEHMGIRPMRISKYCLSVLHCYPGVKYNRFKLKLRQIDRIKRASNAA